MELSTLLGGNDHPAELPGLGYIPAGVARKLAARMGAAQWRFVICTPDGTPICSGITTARPASQPSVLRDPQRGGILELQLTTTDLFELAATTAAGRHTNWQPVIGDIVDRYRSGILDHRPTAQHHTHRTTTADTVGVDTAGVDARRRRARAGLRRWIEVRDRYCLHPACRMPATQTDQDHRIDYAAGGLTVEENLDCHCRHDHNLQHDGRWIVSRPPGTDPLTGPIVWTSPLGHRYESRPPPVMQPYPEPGNHYPRHNSLPEWFTDLVKQAKAAHDDRARAGTPDDDSVDEKPRRPTTPTPDVPPF